MGRNRMQALATRLQARRMRWHLVASLSQCEEQRRDHIPTPGNDTLSADETS